MTSRLYSDKVICGVLRNDFRLPEEEISEKRVIASLSLPAIDPAEVETLSNFLTCPPFCTNERELFREFGSAHRASAEDNEP